MTSKRQRAAQTSPQRPIEELSAHLHEVTQEPVDGPLLLRALTHRSFAYENGDVPHNERLEFLGDSVLGLIVTDHLHATHPDLSEGELAKLRAAVVNMRALAEVARLIDLGAYIRLGRGELTTGGRDKSSILGDTVEAVIGAVYLSSPPPRGLDAAGRLVHSLIGPLMKHSATLGAGLDWKTSLQEEAAAAGLPSPHYRTQGSGPDHAKTFAAEVLVGERCIGEGEGRTKKDAEMQAAQRAYESLQAERVDQPAST